MTREFIVRVGRFLAGTPLDFKGKQRFGKGSRQTVRQSFPNGSIIEKTEGFPLTQQKLVHDRHFYKIFAGLVLSLALQNLLTYSVNLADNLMIGAYSQNALSGISLCNQIQFLLQMMVVGVGEGVVVLGSQYWGKRQLEPIPHIIGAALRFGVTMAFVLFLAALFFPSQILGLLNNDADVLAEGTAYLRIICFTYVIFALTNMLTASLRSIGIVRIGYIVTASTLCINIVLNSLLIYGRCGFPDLGVRGAAIATLVSRCVELLIIIYYLKYHEHQLRLTAKKLVHIDTSYIRDYMKVSLPVLVTQAIWGVAQMIQTGILGNMEGSADVVAANSIAVLVFQIISVVGYGAASAAGIMTGKRVGEGNMERIRQSTRTFQLIFIGLGLITGALIFLASEPVLLLYPKLTAGAADLTTKFTMVLAVTSIGTCYQMAADNGMVRAGGDTKFPMWNNMIFMFGVCLPMASLSAFVWKLSPVVVFFWLKADQLLKCPVICWRVNSYKWVKKVTRDN